MKFGQLIEYNVTNIFLEKSCRRWGRETGFRPLFFYKKALYEIKAKGFHILVSIYFDSPRLEHKTKLNCIKLLDCWPRVMLNFDISEKSLWLVSPACFVNFSRKMFLRLYSINWRNFIVNMFQHVYCKYLLSSLRHHKSAHEIWWVYRI